MNNPSQATHLPHKPGRSEMEALLDLMPDAAVLVDLRTRQIQVANSKAAELTTYTRQEMVGMRLSSLFERLNEVAFWGETPGDATTTRQVLLRRNKSRVEVAAQRSELGTAGKLLMISLTPLAQIQQKKASTERRSSLMGAMETIILAIKQTDLNTSLEMILTAASHVTGTHLMSIYLQKAGDDNPDPEIVRFAHIGPPEPLPARLDASEMAYLRNPHVWMPGKRPTMLLHRTARANGLGYIATTPLGQPKAMIGFLLAASDSPAVSESIAGQLNIFADVISSIIERHSRLANLQAMLKRGESQNSIHKVIEDSVTDGIVVISTGLTILDINATAEVMLGYTHSETIGRRVGDILISASSLAPAIQHALEGTPTLKDETLHFYRRSGQLFHARITVIPTQENNLTNSIIILLQDLTDQEQIQAQAQQMEQRALLGEVTAIFAHEVRNPINNISTGLQLMALNLTGSDPNQELIARLQQDCDRLSELMKSVLAFSRPTEYEMEAVDMRLFMQRLVDRLRPRMVRARVEPLLQSDPELPKVRGNARALEQVFTNLIGNAIQAMAENGGTVAIKLQSVRGGGERGMVQVDIADNGPGISRELQDRLFQPFFTTKTDGTGLGLPITKRIVTAHKGTIQVTSFPGGTVFHVSLPAMETV